MHHRQAILPLGHGIDRLPVELGSAHLVGVLGNQGEGRPELLRGIHHVPPRQQVHRKAVKTLAQGRAGSLLRRSVGRPLLAQSLPIVGARPLQRNREGPGVHVPVQGVRVSVQSRQALRPLIQAIGGVVPAVMVKRLLLGPVRLLGSLLRPLGVLLYLLRVLINHLFHILGPLGSLYLQLLARTRNQHRQGHVAGTSLTNAVFHRHRSGIGSTEEGQGLLQRIQPLGCPLGKLVPSLDHRLPRIQELCGSPRCSRHAQGSKPHAKAHQGGKGQGKDQGIAYPRHQDELSHLVFSCKGRGIRHVLHPSRRGVHPVDLRCREYERKADQQGQHHTHRREPAVVLMKGPHPAGAEDSFVHFPSLSPFLLIHPRTHPRGSIRPRRGPEAPRGLSRLLHPNTHGQAAIAVQYAQQPQAKVQQRKRPHLGLHIHRHPIR